MTLAIAFFLLNTVASNDCLNEKRAIEKKAEKLIATALALEACAEPVAPFLDKVYSNLNYRANRLKTCAILIQKGRTGFDCSREMRKILRSHTTERCKREITEIKKILTANNKKIKSNNCTQEEDR